MAIFIGADHTLYLQPRKARPVIGVCFWTIPGKAQWKQFDDYRHSLRSEVDRLLDYRAPLLDI